MTGCCLSLGAVTRALLGQDDAEGAEAAEEEARVEVVASRALLAGALPRRGAGSVAALDAALRARVDDADAAAGAWAGHACRKGAAHTGVSAAAWLDLYLLAACDALVACNSTFSFVAGLLLAAEGGGGGGEGEGLRGRCFFEMAFPPRADLRRRRA